MHSLFAVLDRSLEAYRHQHLRKVMDETRARAQGVAPLSRLVDAQSSGGSFTPRSSEAYRVGATTRLARLSRSIP